MSSPLGFTDAIGQLKVDTGAVVGTIARGGLAFSTAAKTYATTVVAGTDAIVAGVRRSASGQLVYTPPAAPDQPYVYVNGLPTSKLNGALIAQIDVAPASTDYYVAGVRVGPNGVYMTVL